MSKKNNENKIGIPKFLLWQTSSVSVALSAMVIMYVTVYCTDALGLEPVIVGAVFAASKVLDAFTDMFAGFIIDRTNTRWGKGRPYEIFTLFLWFTTWLLFSCPTDIAQVLKYVWVFVMYVLMNAVCTTFLNANNVVYMVRAFKTQEQQTKITAFGSFFTMGAGLVFNILFPTAMANMATSPAGWSRLIGMMAIPLTAIGLLRMLFIKEQYNNEADSGETVLKISDIVTALKTNHNFTYFAITRALQNLVGNLGCSVYYFTWIIGNVALMGVTAVFSIVGLPLAFFMPVMRRKLGMKRMSTYGFVVAILGYIVMFFANGNLMIVVVASLLTTLAIVPFTMMQPMYIVDCADYNEMIGNPRMEASLGAISGFAGKVGAALGGLVMGAVLSLAGYVGTAETQTSSALMAIRLGSSLIPAAFFVVMIVLMNHFDLDEKLKNWRAEKIAAQTEKTE